MKDQAYLKKVRFLPCCACLSDASDQHRDPHHRMRGVQRGLSMKAGDNQVLPVCRKCHEEIHRTGSELNFFAKHHIHDPDALSTALHECYADPVEGRRAIIRAKIPK